MIGGTLMTEDLHAPETSPSRKTRPHPAWIFRSPARVLVFGFGSGLLRPGPGTWGTLVGWLLWLMALSRLSDAAIAVVLALAFAVGCWLCQRVGRELGVHDHGGMVWDEIVAIWLVLWLTPPSILAQLIAVIIFRFFDILKPPPVRYLDRHIRNGLGVMVDDLMAAAYSLLLMAVLVRFGVL